MQDMQDMLLLASVSMLHCGRPRAYRRHRTEKETPQWWYGECVVIACHDRLSYVVTYVVAAYVLSVVWPTRDSEGQITAPRLFECFEWPAVALTSSCSGLPWL